MPRRCTVCFHPDRKRIDDALFRSKTPFRNVSKQFGVTASALFRHKRHSPISERVRKVTAQMQEIEPRKVNYIRGRLEGKSKKQAALDAGFSHTMAEHAADKIETRDVREVLARLVREMVPPELIAKAIAEGMAATETKFFAHEGVVQDQREVPDYSERRQYAELAAEYGGYHTRGSKEERRGGRVVVILPKPEPEDLAVVEPSRTSKGHVLALPEPLQAPTVEPQQSEAPRCGGPDEPLEWDG